MKSLNRFLNFLIFVVIVAIVGIFHYLQTRPKSVPEITRQALTTEQMDELVNKHLRKTIINEEITKIKNEKAMMDLNDSLALAEKERRQKQDKANAAIPKERQIWKDERLPDRNATEQIKDAINETTENEKMDEAEKKEYARQWILNAKKAGYLLELSPDLEVIKYVPIRKPSQQDDSVNQDRTD